MKIFIIILVIAALTVGSYLIYKGSYNKPTQSSSDTTTSVSTNSVTIQNMAFDPNSITVKAGSEITFTNNNGIDHTVTADNGKFDQAISSGQTITIVIAEPGTYTYHCHIHSSMTGTIIVQ